MNNFQLHSVFFSSLIYLISGDYEVSIKFNDEHIPDSPFIVPIASVSDDGRLLTVTSLQVSDSRSNPLTHESFFSVAAGRGWFRDSPERMAAPLSTHSLWEHLMESTGQLITRRDKCTCSSLHEEWRRSFSRKTNEHVLRWDDIQKLSVWLCVQEMGLKVNQEASFAVQLNGARGAIDAKVHTPSGAVEECYITELDNGEHMATCSWI